MATLFLRRLPILTLRHTTPHVRLSTYQRHINTKELRDADFRSLKVNEDRLMADIHHSCQWGAGTRWGSASTETGMSRLALTEADKDARDWFVFTAKEYGCDTTIDEMGNIFAVRPGIKSGPPTVAGSHLDTQPQGGRYDGILGICAGLEMLKVLNENWIETEFPVGVVNWTNEEGARFPISMLSSAVYSGAIPKSTGHSCISIIEPKVPLLSALQSIDYHGKVPCSFTSNPIAAHFELHIEQGPILESNAQSIGIVTGAQAYRWFTINLTGASSHTGTTPLHSRRDALLAASKMILYSNQSAVRHGGLASTGVIEAQPSSINSVVGSAKFTLDIRAPQDSTVDAMEADILSAFTAISSGTDIDGLGGSSLPISISITTDSHTPATTFHPDCIQCVSDAAANLFGDEFERQTRKMTSGAGHDSVMTSLNVPTSLIFVPSRDGVSHNPREYTSPSDCAMGAQVLLGAILRYDRLRAVLGG